MKRTENGARLASVTESGSGPTPRGAAILERLHALGIDEMSERQLEKVVGVRRQTWKKVVVGEHVTDLTYRRIERALDDYERDEMGDDGPVMLEGRDETFEMSISIGAMDVKVAAKGMPEDADLVREQVARLAAEFMQQTREPPV